VFLIADLLGAAIAAPMLVGLYSRRMPGWAVLVAGGAGIIIGALFYPKPDLISPWAISAPTGGQMFWAFASALVVSSAISAVVVVVRRMVAPDQEYDFDILGSGVQLIDEPVIADD
jgi:Na+/proline symporter